MTRPGNALRERTAPLRPRLAADTSVKIIGLGGVGAIVARYGAMFLRALATEVRLVLIDGDSYEASNASRMLFGRTGNKAAVVREELLPHVRESRVTLLAIEEYVTEENVGRLIQEGDIVALAVDNHATRKLVGEFCASQRRDVCLVSGGNDGVGEDASGRLLRGTYGNCQIHVRARGADVSPPLTHLHPEIREPADHLPTSASCTELAGSVPQILFANLTVAAAMLNTLWLHLCGALHYGEICFDIADGLMRPVLSLALGHATAQNEDAPHRTSGWTTA
jgi:hypothetical protein